MELFTATILPLATCIHSDAGAYSLSAFVTAALLYVLLRLTADWQTASAFAGACSWVVPSIDLVSNLVDPPSSARLDAFFAWRELAFLASFCGTLLLRAHGHLQGIVHANTLIGISWTLIWCRSGDARPATLFVPLVVAPSLLAAMVVPIVGLLHEAKASSEPLASAAPTHGEAVKAHDGTEPSPSSHCSWPEASSFPAEINPERGDDLPSLVHAMVCKRSFQGAALAMCALWGVIIHYLRSAPVSWDDPPIPVAVTWPLLAVAYLVTLSLYGPRAAASVWEAACFISPSVGFVGALIVPLPTVRRNVDATRKLASLATGMVMSGLLGVVHAMQPLTARRKALLAVMVLVLHSLITLTVSHRLDETEFLASSVPSFLMPFAFCVLLTLGLRSHHELRLQLGMEHLRRERLEETLHEVDLQRTLSSCNSSGSDVQRSLSVSSGSSGRGSDGGSSVGANTEGSADLCSGSHSPGPGSDRAIMSSGNSAASSSSRASVVSFAPSVDELELTLTSEKVHTLNRLILETAEHARYQALSSQALSSQALSSQALSSQAHSTAPALSAPPAARAHSMASSAATKVPPRLSLQLPKMRSVTATASDPLDNSMQADQKLIECLLHDLPPGVLAKRVCPHEVRLKEILGHGSFGTVHRAEWVTKRRGSQQRVAAKLLHRHQLNVGALSQFKRSLALELALAPHDNIVRLHSWLADPTDCRVMLVLEHARGGSLERLIDNGTCATWGEGETLQVCGQMARGIAFLHSQQPPIIHRDLKPGNILFDEGRPKLADFGVSRASNSTTLTACAVGTLAFAAPEQLQYSQYTVSVDVWAFGCVLACVALNSSIPYPDRRTANYSSDEDGQLISAVARGILRPSTPVDHFLHAHVRDCVASEPTARPAAAELARVLSGS